MELRQNIYVTLLNTKMLNMISGMKTCCSYLQLELAGTERTFFVLRLLECETSFLMKSDVQRISKSSRCWFTLGQAQNVSVQCANFSCVSKFLSSTFLFYASYILCVLIFPVVFLLYKLLNCVLLVLKCFLSLYMFPLLLLIYLLNQLLYYLTSENYDVNLHAVLLYLCASNYQI